MSGEERGSWRAGPGRKAECRGGREGAWEPGGGEEGRWEAVGAGGNLGRGWESWGRVSHDTGRPDHTLGTPGHPGQALINLERWSIASYQAVGVVILQVC